MEASAGVAGKQQRRCACACLGRSGRHLLAGVATNVGICCLLVGYTLLGAIAFLAIEGRAAGRAGGAGDGHHILATTSRRVVLNGSELQARAAAARAHTVEHIWDVTVNLNILYRDNWTRLAAAEIARFQDEILRSVAAAAAVEDDAVVGQQAQVHQVEATADVEWTFAMSFLYSLTVLTTIGCGSLAPRTPLGKAVTMGYAVCGIPLTLLYLSSVGGALSRAARGAFSRALCCCLCSNCGYCCYDERRMADKERRMRRKRQHLEMRQQQQMALPPPPFYVQQQQPPPPPTQTDAGDGCCCCCCRRRSSSCSSPTPPPSSASSSTSSSAASSAPAAASAILAPIALCVCVMAGYVGGGALALFHLERWPPLEGAYFCFMSLTTIGVGAPLAAAGAAPAAATVWFCSAYIIAGMALTAMCFSVVHDELVHRLRHDERRLRRLRRLRKPATLTSFPDSSDALPPPP